MSTEQILFYILSAVIIGCALVAVITRKVLRAAVFLLFSLIGIAGLYFLLSYEFIAAVQIVVYVGGIVVLIIFSVLLTHDSGGDMSKPKGLRVLFSFLSVGLAFAGSTYLLLRNTFVSTGSSAIALSMKSLGRSLLNTGQLGYLLPFEVVSFLLLAALVGCIVIAIKIKPKE